MLKNRFQVLGDIGKELTNTPVRTSGKASGKFLPTSATQYYMLKRNKKKTGLMPTAGPLLTTGDIEKRK